MAIFFVNDSDIVYLFCRIDSMISIVIQPGWDCRLPVIVSRNRLKSPLGQRYSKKQRFAGATKYKVSEMLELIEFLYGKGLFAPRKFLSYLFYFFYGNWVGVVLPGFTYIA